MLNHTYISFCSPRSDFRDSSWASDKVGGAIITQDGMAVIDHVGSYHETSRTEDQQDASTTCTRPHTPPGIPRVERSTVTTDVQTDRFSDSESDNMTESLTYFQEDLSEDPAADNNNEFEFSEDRFHVPAMQRRRISSMRQSNEYNPLSKLKRKFSESAAWIERELQRTGTELSNAALKRQIQKEKREFGILMFDLMSRDDEHNIVAQKELFQKYAVTVKAMEDQISSQKHELEKLNVSSTKSEGSTIPRNIPPCEREFVDGFEIV